MGLGHHSICNRVLLVFPNGIKLHNYMGQWVEEFCNTWTSQHSALLQCKKYCNAIDIGCNPVWVKAVSWVSWASSYHTKSNNFLKSTSSSSLITLVCINTCKFILDYTDFTCHLFCLRDKTTAYSLHCPIEWISSALIYFQCRIFGIFFKVSWRLVRVLKIRPQLSVVVTHFNS